MAFLVDIENDRRYELGTVATIGRDRSSTVVVDDPLVSPRHAEIRRRDDGTYQIVDLGSRRGTFRGDRRVSDALLRDGDELLVGTVRLRFEVAKEAKATGAARQLNGQSYLPASEVADTAQLRRDYEKLRAAFELSQALSEAQGLPGLLGAVLDTAFRVLAADRGLIMLFDPVTLQPTTQIARHRDGKEAQVAVSTSVLSKIIETRAGVVTADTGTDQLFNRASSLLAQSIGSAMCVPMIRGQELIGLIHLDSRSASGIFSDKDLDLFTVIASQAAVAIDRSLLAEQVIGAATLERQRLARLVRDLPDGVLLLDRNRSVSLSNPQADRLLPLLGNVEPGAPLERLGPFAIEDLLERADAAEVTVGGPPRRVLALRAFLSTGPEGTGTAVLLRDVTEEREQQARLAQQDRLAIIGQLAGGVAHDFNNLIAVISNFASFVHDAVREKEVLSDVEQIQGAAVRAAELTRHLLAFGRLDPPRTRVVVLDEVIGAGEKLLRRSLRADIDLEMRLSTGRCRIKVDPTKLEQVLLNLAVNARDAMPAGGRVIVETSTLELTPDEARPHGITAGQYVSIAVTDEGTGMPPEVAARVFEPFFTTKEAGKGTGLGLATAHDIVRQAGGAISVRSVEGQGSTFRILLPVTSELPDEELRNTAIRTRGSETVLVAEDEAPVRAVVRRILADAGYKVLEAANGEEALALAQRHSGSIDLLLADLVMPGMGGKELARRLCNGSAATRVLYLSGYFGPSGDSEPSQDQFLAKPFTRDELLARVRAQLDATPTLA
ncbi:MAG: ATP-binding protein [Myxococcales bacterium]